MPFLPVHSQLHSMAPLPLHPQHFVHFQLNPPVLSSCCVFWLPLSLSACSATPGVPCHPLTFQYLVLYCLLCWHHSPQKQAELLEVPHFFCLFLYSLSGTRLYVQFMLRDIKYINLNRFLFPSPCSRDGLPEFGKCGYTILQ